MARKKAPPSKPFTEAEDYFITGQVGLLPPAELAKRLERTEAEVEARMKDLGINMAEAVRKQKLVGFSVHPSGAVAMTGSRSKADDDAAQKDPATNEEFFNKYKDCIRRG